MFSKILVAAEYFYVVENVFNSSVLTKIDVKQVFCSDLLLDEMSMMIVHEWN